LYTSRVRSRSCFTLTTRDRAACTPCPLEALGRISVINSLLMSFDEKRPEARPSSLQQGGHDTKTNEHPRNYCGGRELLRAPDAAAELLSPIILLACYAPQRTKRREHGAVCRASIHCRPVAAPTQRL
jgi:hypothetical protein